MVDMRAISIVWPVERKETRKNTHTSSYAGGSPSTGVTKCCTFRWLAPVVEDHYKPALYIIMYIYMAQSSQ